MNVNPSTNTHSKSGGVHGGSEHHGEAEGSVHHGERSGGGEHSEHELSEDKEMDNAHHVHKRFGSRHAPVLNTPRYATEATKKDTVYMRQVSS